MADYQPPEDLKDRLRASYNSVAKEYNTWTEQHHHLRMKYLDQLYEHAPSLAAPSDPGPRVLELGAGAGVPLASSLLSRNPSLRLLANDLSDVQLSLARQNLAAYAPRTHYLAGDMTSPAVDAAVGEPASLAAVVALFSLIHLPQDEQREMVRRIADWLQPGGHLLANFSGGEATRGEEMRQWLGEGGWMFWSGLGTQATLAVLDEVGLEVLVKEKEMEGGSEFLWIIARKRG